jgi:pyrroline-5-carboxylate reductase
MPNTPCSIKRGMTAVCAGSNARAVHTELAQALFTPVGRVVTVDEAHMDSVTGLSASGPAFVYIIIESLAEAGVKVGLPRELATELAAQTVLGAASMVIETGEHPARLKDAVTTPAGCTIDGGGLRVTLIKAVVKAAERAKALADG